MLLCRIPLQPVFWVYTVSDNRAVNLVLHPRGTVHGTKSGRRLPVQKVLAVLRKPSLSFIFVNDWCFY